MHRVETDVQVGGAGSGDRTVSKVAEGMKGRQGAGEQLNEGKRWRERASGGQANN